MARPLTDIDAGREHLLELVEHLIRKRGAASVTLSELAAEADMSPANIYRYFENKDALFEAVAERWFAPKVAIMEEVVGSDLPVPDKLYAFFARRFILMRDNYLDEPALFQSYMELGLEHEETIRGHIDLGDHFLAMIVAEAMEEGYFSGLSIDRTVSLINLMMFSFINPTIMIDMMHSVTDEKLSQIVGAILAGLGTQAETIQARPALRAV
jgi:TetR/AcrR family transcriptional regulator, repressor of the ameABC operon